MMNRYSRAAIALTAAVGFLSACSTNPDTEASSPAPVEQPTAQSAPVEEPTTQSAPAMEEARGPVVPADVIVQADAAPQNYRMDDVNQLTQQQLDQNPEIRDLMDQINDGVSTDPEQCASLVPTPISFISSVFESPDAIAVREFVDPETEGTINVSVASQPDLLNQPQDVSACNTVTRDTPVGYATYQVAPMDHQAEGTDGFSAFEVTVSDSDNELIGKTGDQSHIAFFTVDGAAVTVWGSEQVPVEDFTVLLDKQVDKILQR